MARIPEVFNARIVAVGDFNPAIFNPDWLERNNLIGSEDAISAREHEGLIISRQASVVHTDWFVLQVVEENLTIVSKGPVSPTLKDLAVGILGLAAQTPVRAVGLNFHADYKMNTADDRHKIGDVLAPKAIWYEIFPQENQNVGLASLVIQVQPGARERGAPDNDDQKNVTVQPSRAFPNGILFSVNNHFDLKHRLSSELTSAEVAAKIVDEEWQNSWVKSQELFGQVIDKALAAGE